MTIFRLSLLPLVIIAFSSPATAGGRQPNIEHLMVDDLGTVQDTSALNAAIAAAQTTTGRTVSEEPYAKAIRSLRREIRALNVPDARHPDLNWHPEETEPTQQLPKTP